jgi:hypothetical protein
MTVFIIIALIYTFRKHYPNFSNRLIRKVTGVEKA